jgi:hypothetical protein
MTWALAATLMSCSSASGRDAGELDAGACFTGYRGPVVPDVACTPGLLGASVCMTAGLGYDCAAGSCWSGFDDGVCQLLERLLDGGQRMFGVDFEAPASPCTAAQLSQVSCLTGRNPSAGYLCTTNGWSLFFKGPCPSSERLAGLE